MWWILIVGVVAVAAWFFFRTNKPERSQPPEKTLKELVAAPEVEAPPVTLPAALMLSLRKPTPSR